MKTKNIKSIYRHKNYLTQNELELLNLRLSSIIQELKSLKKKRQTLKQEGLKLIIKGDKHLNLIKSFKLK